MSRPAGPGVKVTERDRQMMELQRRRQQFEEVRIHNEKKLQKLTFQKRRKDLTLKDATHLRDSTVAYKQIGRLYIKKPMVDLRAQLKTEIAGIQAQIDSSEETRGTIMRRIQNLQEQMRELQASDS